MRERDHLVRRALTNAADKRQSISLEGDTDEGIPLAVLGRDSVAPFFWEPFIRTGYRLNGRPLLDYLRYTLVLHNDVVNFWSHFLVFLAWAYFLVHMLAVGTIPLDAYHYPMVCYLASACTYAFCSSFAHLLSAKSFHFRTVCFMFDYHGISVYAFGFMMASFYYERPVNHWFYASKWLHLGAYAVISVMATLFCCLTRFYWSRFRFVVRTGIYTVPVCFGSLPIILRIAGCEEPEDCNSENYVLLLVGYLVTVLSAFFFATKLPERVFPLTFDIFGASHQLFHFTISIATTIQMKFLISDSSVRRSTLEQDSAQPTFGSSVLVYVGASMGNFLIFLVFTALRVRGYLRSRKEMPKSEDGLAAKRATTS